MILTYILFVLGIKHIYEAEERNSLLSGVVVGTTFAGVTRVRQKQQHTRISTSFSRLPRDGSSIASRYTLSSEFHYGALKASS